MSMDYRQAYCWSCGRYVRGARPGTNHVFHLIMTAFLGFVTLPLLCIGAIFWLFVWAGSSIKFGGWQCVGCGSTKLQFPGLFQKFPARKPERVV
jgi:hypothetical protein